MIDERIKILIEKPQKGNGLHLENISNERDNVRNMFGYKVL